MPVHSISPEELKVALAGTGELQIRNWCAALEAGGVLYFPQTPVRIPPADLDVLLGQQQTGSRLHKNIAYKPNRDELTGVDAKSSPGEVVEQVHDIMRRYSKSVEGFLAQFLAPYQKRWMLDYASYRPLEEQGRDLPVRRRNDLLHTDAFPTRPTRGWRILRFFHNIHPMRTRDWDRRSVWQSGGQVHAGQAAASPPRWRAGEGRQGTGKGDGAGGARSAVEAHAV
jgi:hypothetical protein